MMPLAQWKGTTIMNQSSTSFAYVQRNDGTYRISTNGKYTRRICSFGVEVQNAYIQRTGAIDTLRFDLLLTSGVVQTMLQNICEQSLQQLKWDTLPAVFRITPSFRSNIEFFLEMVQQKLAKLKPPILYVPSQQGWNMADGMRYFLFGNKLILPPALEDKVILPEHCPFTVTLNRKIPEEDLASWFLQVLTSVPSLSLPLCLANILGILHSKFREHGHIPEGWLWVIGRSSAGKTSLVQTLCTLFNRDSGLKTCTIPASSSIAYASRQIRALKDTCCIIDDNAITEGANLTHRQTMLIDELLRSSSNGVTRGVCVAGEEPASCYFIGTSESGFHAESVVNRGIALEVPFERIDFTELNSCLKVEAHQLESFYENFIRWLVQRDDFDSWLNQHVQNAAHPAQSHLLRSPRIASHIAFYQLAGELLVDYFASLSLLDAGKEQKWRNYINAQLQKLYEQQLVLLSRIHNRPDDWLVRALYEIVHNGKLNIVNSKRLTFPPDCDGFIAQRGPKTKWLYIHRDSFFRILDEHSIRITPHEVRKALDPYDILIHGSEGEITRNTGGERSIVLDWSQLVIVASKGNYQPK